MVIESGLQAILATLSGGFAGFSLGLIGGGGSVLAVPLLIYFVGISDPHIAIGTSALAVALNAFANLLPHARAGHVRWRSAFIFGTAGVIGAYGGSTLGKLLDGQKLLFLFAIVMMVVAVVMAKPRKAGPVQPECRKWICFMPVVATGLVVGALSGFFGIGGGFLIVPGLVFSTGMPLIEAIGTSLFAVGAFGLTTAGNYAVSGLINGPIAAVFIAGGIVGGWGGMLLAKRLSKTHRMLNLIFAVVVFAVGVYVLIKNIGAFV
jgi:hypothetical protein